MRSSAILLATALALAAPASAMQNPPVSDITDQPARSSTPPMRLGSSVRPVPESERITGDTLTANPAAFRKWLKRKIIEDLVNLYDVTNSLVVELAPEGQVVTRQTEKKADQIVKLSHNIWSNVQMRRPTRERPKPDRSAAARPIRRAQADAVTARDLVRQVARLLNEKDTSGGYDAQLQVDLLEKLEQVELIGHQLKLDIAGAPGKAR